MALHDERMRERLLHLFAEIAVEPTVSYPDIIDAVRRTKPPETVWALAGDMADHLTSEPLSFFPPDEARIIRRGMAARWVESVLGELPAYFEGILGAWEGIHFAGIPPLRVKPLRYFSERHSQEVNGT